jgi:hypothetical protein
MAIAVDATRTESIRTDTSTTYAFNYTPTTAPRGIVVTAIHSDSSTDHITGITYGGVAMRRVVTAADTATEAGRSYIYYLGAGVLTGTREVSVSIPDATTDDIEFVVFGLNLGGTAADIAVVDFDAIQENTTNPSVVEHVLGRSAVSIAAFYYGGSAAPTPNANMTNLHTHDFTSQFGSVDMQTTPGTADFTVSYSSSDDTGLSVAAFAQAVVTSQAVDATSAHTMALARGIAKSVAASVTGTAAMARVKSVAQTVAATVGAAVALQRGVGHGIAATVGGVVALSRRTATTVAATSTATIAMARVKAALVIIDVATTATAALSRTTTKVIDVVVSLAAVLDTVKTSINQDYPQAIDAATDLAVSVGRGMGKVIDFAAAMVAKVMTGTPADGRINGPTHSSTSNGKTESTLGPAPTKAIQDVDVGV